MSNSTFDIDLYSSFSDEINSMFNEFVCSHTIQELTTICFNCYKICSNFYCPPPPKTITSSAFYSPKIYDNNSKAMKTKRYEMRIILKTSILSIIFEV